MERNADDMPATPREDAARGEDRGAMGAGGAADTAKEKLADVGSTVKEKAADVGSAVREKAGTAKNSLADMLESGADKLRQRNQVETLVAADAAGGTTAVSTDKVAQATDKLAGGMQATADWLREADLDSLRSGIETQVREHPGRTLLIALGAGYLLGKAFRK